MNLERRVVITGLGVTCPLGKTAKEFWENLKNGRTSIRNLTKEYTLPDGKKVITHPWLSNYPVQIGSVFPEWVFDAKSLGLGPIAQRSSSLFSQYALVAAHEAITDSGILEGLSEEGRINLGYRTGVVIGTGSGPVPEIERHRDEIRGEGLNPRDKFLIPRILLDAASGIVALNYGFHATSCEGVVGACAAGSMAIINAYNYIRLGDADVMIAGGSEASLGGKDHKGSLAVFGFNQCKALTTDYNDDPEKASRPFDKDRSGFVIGEGAGILVLEDYDHAKKRGAVILAELLGYGATCDATRTIMAPNKEGEYSARAMMLAMQRSGVNPEDIQYINAHGTSTPDGDLIETLAIYKAFGEYAKKIPISSTKSMAGHTLGASGALEAIATVKSIEEGVIHPTINLVNPGEGCDLDYTPGDAREMNVKKAITNSLAFWGHNVSIVLSEPR